MSIPYGLGYVNGYTLDRIPIVSAAIIPEGDVVDTSLPLTTPDGALVMIRSLAAHPVTAIGMIHVDDPHAQLDALRDYRLGQALDRLDRLLVANMISGVADRMTINYPTPPFDAGRLTAASAAITFPTEPWHHDATPEARS